MKVLFDLIISPLYLFENPIYNYIVMAVIGLIAFEVAFFSVGELGLDGGLGSLVHWIIRLFVLVAIWAICCCIIELIKFVISNWIIVISVFILVSMLLMLIIYAKQNPNCVLNKNIFEIIKKNIVA